MRILSNRFNLTVSNKKFLLVRIVFVFALLLPPITKSKTQEKPIGTAEASQRLLDAVDSRDISRVKALLSHEWGRSLVRLPVGLLAVSYTHLTLPTNREV